MDKEDQRYMAYHRCIGELHQQLALLPLDDPRRCSIYRDLLWLYHESLALIWARIEALIAKRRALPQCQHQTAGAFSRGQLASVMGRSSLHRFRTSVASSETPRGFPWGR